MNIALKNAKNAGILVICVMVPLKMIALICK